MTPDAHGKPQIFECEQCLANVGIDNLKVLVVPKIISTHEGPDTIWIKFKLCGECYDDFMYSMLENWDAQREGKVGTKGAPPPAPSDPPPDQRVSGPLKPAAAPATPSGVAVQPLGRTDESGSERGQPGVTVDGDKAGGAPETAVEQDVAGGTPAVATQQRDTPPPAEPRTLCGNLQKLAETKPTTAGVLAAGLTLMRGVQQRVFSAEPPEEVDE